MRPEWGLLWEPVGADPQSTRPTVSASATTTQLIECNLISLSHYSRYNPWLEVLLGSETASQDAS